ncbi:MAG TPA: amidohydrolase family protein [Cyclobacteriaceae bacterium]|nr:amidohydrolase family protein [Cyclobacteriaceae bacterium]
MRFIILFLCLAFISVINAQAQHMSKKESAAIDKILLNASKANKPRTYIIKNVGIVTMKNPEVRNGQSVLIENGRIQKIAGEIQNQGATVIDGSGKYLMPGLTDMHVHLFDRHQMKNTWMLMLLINGVTTVRDMCGEPGKIQLREKIKTNDILGPNLYQAGPIIDGNKENMGLFAFADTPQKGREIVLSQKKAGYDFIKVYDALTREVYAAIIDEAHKQGMQVTGHLPDHVTLDDAINLEQNSIEHITGYIEWTDYQVHLNVGDDYPTKTAGSSTWNCPTLYNHFMNGSRAGAREMMLYADGSGLLPKGLRDNWSKIVNSNSKAIIEIADKYGASNHEVIKKIVLNLYSSGAKLIAGTDAGSLPLIIPGYSLHQELKHLNELGIATYDVLKMATANAAQAMNKTDFGTIEEGNRADLLLLNANPLDGVANLQDKAGVMIRGVWLPKEELDRIATSMQAAFRQ